jgi:hypothetical protein
MNNTKFFSTGNSNLVYTIIRKRAVFHQLANLPTDHSAIAKALTKRGKKFVQPGGVHDEAPSMEGSVPATEAEPGTLQATLAATPGKWVSLLGWLFVSNVSSTLLSNDNTLFLIVSDFKTVANMLSVKGLYCYWLCSSGNVLIDISSYCSAVAFSVRETELFSSLIS